MAIDPNIALSAGAGVPAPGNPMLMATQAQALATGAANNRLVNINADQAQQTLANDSKNWIAKQVLSILPVAAQGPDGAKKAWPMIESALNDGIASGRISQQLANASRDWLHSTEDQGSLVSGLHRLALNSLDIPTQVQHMFGGQDLVDFGGAKAPVTTTTPFGRAMTGNPQVVTSVGPEINNTLSPASQTDLVDVRQPDGSVKQFTRLQMAAMGGGAGSLGTGRIPPGLLNGSRPQPDTQGGIKPVGQSASTATAASQSATGTASASAFQRIADEGVAARSQDAILGNMLADTTQFVTGPGQDRVKGFQAALTSWAPGIAKSFGIDPKSVASNESFDKLAAQIAGAQGAGSDARLAVAQHGNPSSSLTPQGVDMMLRKLRGNAAYIQARQQAAAAYPDKTDSQGFEANIAKNLDPRAFQLDHMTTSQRGEYLNAMSPADQEAIKKSYLWAKEKKLIGGGNAGR